GRRRGGVGAVALVVASGDELVGVGADDRAVGGRLVAGADELVVAGERLVVGVGEGVAELAGVAREHRRLRQRAVVGEAGVLGPDAGVDDADQDAGAVDALVVGLTATGQVEEVLLGRDRGRVAGVVVPVPLAGPAVVAAGVRG